MVFAPSVIASFPALLPSVLSRDHVYFGFSNPISFFHSVPSTSHFTAITLSRRQKLNSVITSAKKKKPTSTTKKTTPKKKQVVSDDEDELDEDAFEALFKQLEEDLKNDNLSLDDFSDDDITEEEFAQFERELKEALGDDDIEIAASVKDEDENEDEDEGEDEDEDEDDEITPVELKRWQLRRLASALKIGRRKTNIKSLAAELGLERSIVLELLRNPTPDLLMMCATMPDEPEPREIVLHPEIVEVVSEMTDEEDAAEPNTKEKEAPHLKQQRWSAQKRLKKVQVQTMENVYRKTKRPTNAMISSIVQVTSLPRKRIVKWFEDKRAEEGVPDQRRPYQKPAPETVSSP